MLQRLAEGGADLARDGRIDRQRLVDPLQHQHALAPAQQRHQEIGGEGPEHGQVDDAHAEGARFAQMTRAGMRIAHHRALAHDQVVGTLDIDPARAGITAPAQRRVLVEGAIGQLGQVIEVEGALCRDPLLKGVGPLQRADQCRMVDVEKLGNAPSSVAEDQALCRRGCIDLVGRIAQKLGDQLRLRQPDRLESVAGEVAVLGAEAGTERQLGDAASDQRQIAGALHVAREELKEAGGVRRTVGRGG